MAQYHLGCFHRWGVEEDEAEAVRWYLKAAEQGHSEAPCELGGSYRQGIGVEKNFLQAVQLSQGG